MTLNQKKEQIALQNLIDALGVHKDDPTPLQNEVRKYKAENKLLRQRIQYIKESNKTQKKHLNRTKEEQDFEQQIADLEANIIEERKKTRLLERLKLKDHKNYGKDETDFNDQLVKFEEERKKVKYEKLEMYNIKANLRAQLRSP